MTLVTRDLDPIAVADLINTFDLERLLRREIHNLSGGEAVRLALASSLAQGIGEIHIDTALEQLDVHWRDRILPLLASSRFPAARFVIVDNHLTKHEKSLFRNAIRFPLDGAAVNNRWSQSIIPREAATFFLNSDAQMIEMDGVAFSYKPRLPPVFNGVSLTLTPGCVYVLEGGNGSGKTTFVKLLSGTLLPDEGQIRFGRDVFAPEKSPARYAGVAFQNPDFQWTSHCVLEEVSKANQIWRTKADPARVLFAFGLPEALQKSNPNDLPFAFKKRLGIALSVLFGKPWLILDEPTLGQDQDYRSTLVDFINIIVERGAGVVLVSHDASFRSAFPGAKRLLLGNGKILSA